MQTAIRAPLVHVAGRGFQPDTSVIIDGGRIVSVVSRDQEPPDAVMEEWEDLAIVPGTVNAHGHSFQSLLKGLGDDRRFESWRDDVLYPTSEKLTRSGIYSGALFAFAEALLAGATTVVDFFYLHDDGNENAERVIEAARTLGVRLVLARAFYDPDAPTPAPARFREPHDVAAARCRGLAEAHAGDPMVSIQPAPHSLHAVELETIAVARGLALDLGVPWHIHVAEAAYERIVTQKRFGRSPVRTLAEAGLLDRSTVTIHSVWVDDEEIELLAASGAGVVHCPGANAFLGDGIAKLPEMVAAGVRVALGADGGCANNRQNIFQEMAMASQLAKARTHDGAAMDAHIAFDLGTRMGGDLLGLPVGTIAPGMHADLVGLDLLDLSLQPFEHLQRHVVNSMQPTAIRRVMVGGKIVVDNGRLTQMEHGELRRRIDDTVNSLR